MTAVLDTTHTLFRAFADETRLRLLNLLLEGKMCVCELCDVLEMRQPSISRHLAYLNRAGLIEARQDGKWKYYRVARKPDRLQKRLLDCIRSCLRDLEILSEDLERRRTLQAQSCC